MRSSPEIAGEPLQAGQTGSAIGVRRAVFAVIGLLIAGALYLIAVRGSAILADIAAVGARVWCF